MKHAWAVIVIAVAAASALAADDPWPTIRPDEDAVQQVEVRVGPWRPEWGTDDSIVQGIAAWGFMPTHSNNVGWGYTSQLYLWSTLSPVDFFSPLTLPAGARIVALELEACDSSATKEATFALNVCPHRGAHFCDTVGPFGTGLAETPGCGGFFAPVVPPVTVDNLTNTYILIVGLDALDTTSFLSVLVSYQLQVSPAPAVATFADVPVGAFAFQHIEALAASGITAGCGGGNFCPDSPLTRAQMAVFLAKALGLHWPY